MVAPVSEYPALGSLARLEHEYSLRDELDPDWALRPLTLTRREERMMLVLEDPGGEPLDQCLGKPLELGRFLRLAINLAAGLGKLHRRWLIHKDIKPANILVDFTTDKVWFTGFGIASRLPREKQTAEPPEVIAGTLAYMAPEQTGRMNRSIDSRSDLYSLGITFYEMLTGVLPFRASDPMEWVHCHFARQPPKPSERTERIRLEGRDLDAMRLYEEAIRAARENGFVQNGGLANELAAQFYLKRGIEKVAHSYLRDARYCYLRWGALGKVQQLDERCPAIEERASLRPATTIGTSVEQLDLGTVMKASHAVAGEIVLEKLIKTLMMIAVEHAGAEHGLLILPHGEELRIVAEATNGRDGVEVQLRQAAATPAELPESLLRYVIRTQQSVILDDASSQSLFPMIRTCCGSVPGRFSVCRWLNRPN